MSEEFEDLICIGCAMLASNGEDIGDGGDGVEPLANSDGYHVIVGDAWGFGKSSCTGCGSRLAGDRFAATFVPIGGAS